MFLDKIYDIFLSEKELLCYYCCQAFNDDRFYKLEERLPGLFLINIYNAAANEMEKRMNSCAGDADYDPVYDLNSDGVINVRDFSALRKTKPQ